MRKAPKMRVGGKRGGKGAVRSTMTPVFGRGKGRKSARGRRR